MAYIVHGATGAQGSPVMSALTAAGHTAVAAVRNPDAVADGVPAVAVNLASADSLTSAYEGADGVFVHLPIGAPETAKAQVPAIVEAVNRARPRRVVISTSGQIVDQPGSPLQAAADSPIMTLVDGVRSSGVSTAVVAPRLYLENLLMPIVLRPAREQGVLRYPLLTSFPIPWSSHLDVADVVARLLPDDSVTETVAVGHVPGLTGSDIAPAFSTYLNRDVRFEAITPDEFGELITPVFGSAAAPVIARLNQVLTIREDFAISRGNSAQALLGLSPRPVEQWLEDLAV